MFDKIKYYYKRGFWNIQRVWNIVGITNGISEKEYTEITGFIYPNKE